MNCPDLENLEARIDRDRRERERETLLLLLLLSGQARRYGYAAIRVGADPYAAIAAVLSGSQPLGLPGGASRLARLLLLADLDGFRRTQLVLPGPTVRYQPAVNYQSTAAIALAQTLATLQRRIAQERAKAKPGVSGSLVALRLAFMDGGYTEANPYRLRTAAETLIGTAYGAGYFNGWRRPEAVAEVRGLHYSAVLDDRTTPICNTYDGVRLPANHPWWLSHWPLNHWGCRSVVLPIIGRFTATANPPYIPPPMAGFGRAPFAAFVTVL